MSERARKSGKAMVRSDLTIGERKDCICEFRTAEKNVEGTALKT
jgi:hypothetical protein